MDNNHVACCSVLSRDSNRRFTGILLNSQRFVSSFICKYKINSCKSRKLGYRLVGVVIQFLLSCLVFSLTKTSINHFNRKSKHKLFLQIFLLFLWYPYRMFVSLICIFVSLIYCVSPKGLFVVVYLQAYVSLHIQVKEHDMHCEPTRRKTLKSKAFKSDLHSVWIITIHLNGDNFPCWSHSVHNESI